MKKSLLALACLATLTASAGALAQSSVTMFGIVDAAVRQVKNGSAGSQKQVASGSNATSRFGLRGVEDLGDGLRAAFHLESQINTDAGTVDTTRFWGRRSTVSLLGRMGEVRLGRDYTPTAYNTFSDEFGIVGVGSRGIFSYGFGSNLGSPATTVLRADNTVGYLLPPNLGGVYGHFQVAAGEGVVGNKYAGLRVGYKAGPLDVGFAYGKTDTGSTPDFKNYNLMLNYSFGFVNLYTLYDAKNWSPRKTRDVSVAVEFPFGQNAIRVGYTRANRSGGAAGSGFANADDASRIGIGHIYYLSKRTAMYSTYGRVTNKGASRNSVLYTPPTGMLGGQPSSGLEFGLRHIF